MASFLKIQPLGDDLCYLPAYSLIVCKDHSAVRNWRTHLSRSHKVSKESQRQLNTQYQIQSLPLSTPENHPLPPPNQPPISVLGLPIPGFACSYQTCTFLTANRQSIKKHYNKEHNWISS